MQTDIWLTQPAQPTQCPLCSKPLRASSKTCYACGFSLESPKSTGSSVWIDPAVYTYQSPTTGAQSAETSKVTPDAVKPTGSVVWEGNEQPQTRKRSGSTSNPSLSKHTSPLSKSVAKPVHTRRRTYTRSLTQTQGGTASARPPAPQPPMWQYESPNFEAGSSLPALSLLVAETPTQPGAALPDIADDAAIDEIDTIPPLLAKRSHEPPAQDSWLISGSSLISDAFAVVEPAEAAHESLPSAFSPASYAQIDKIDTVPEHLGVQFIAPSHAIINHAPTSPTHLDEIDTVPEHVGVQFIAPSASRALVPINTQVAAIPATDSSSWTAGGSARSGYARHIVDHSRRKSLRSMRSFNPFDSVRWWLLRPGRIEFLLWLGGTILLISITCVLLLVTAFSLNWITPGLRSSVTSSPSSLTNTAPQGRVLPTVTSSPGLIFALLDKGPFLPGQSIHVHGQGFTHNGKVVFTLDNPQLPANPSAWTQADAHGGFTTTLTLGYGLAPGPHLIIAHDMKTDSLAAIPFRIAQGPIGKKATATPVPVTPGATVTPGPGKPGSSPTPAPTSIGTPVGIGVSPTPTPSPSPTATPTKTPTPTPTPTVGVTPTPTPGTTPTPKPSPTTAVTPSSSPTAAVPLTSSLSGDSGPGGGLSNALGNSDTPTLGAQLAHLAPWLWLPMLFYILSMFMLGLAGILHKRRTP